MTEPIDGLRWVQRGGGFDAGPPELNAARRVAVLDADRRDANCGLRLAVSRPKRSGRGPAAGRGGARR